MRQRVAFRGCGSALRVAAALVTLLVLSPPLARGGAPAATQGGPAADAGAEVQVAFVGDVMLASRVATLIGEQGSDYPWRQVAPVLQNADLAVGNLECAVGTTGQPQEGKEWAFRASPVALEGLARAGIDVVSLGNNHARDFGTDCFLETMDHLQRVSVAYVAGGRNLGEAARPYVADLNGIKIGVLGVCRHMPGGWGASADGPGVFPGYDQRQLLKAIEDLDATVDWTVVFIHWGVERADYPEEWQQVLARHMLRAGADLIIGHHPHVWQGIDRRERSLVAYSLGNFIFTIRPEFPQQQQTGVLVVTLTHDRIREVRVVPCHIPRAGETVLAQGELARRILNRIDRLSAPFDTWVAADGCVERVPFPDVRDHWAREYIGVLSTRGIVTGDDTGRFRPDSPTTQAELSALLVRTLELPEVPPSGLPHAPAPELPADLRDHWSAPLLHAALAAGVISAGEAVLPAVDAPVPRWQTARMLAAATAAAGRALPPAEALPAYTDLGTAPRPALDPIARVTAAGLMNGYPDGRFGPNDTLTRAQMASVLFRLLHRLEPPGGGAPVAGSGQGTPPGPGPDATPDSGPGPGGSP